MKRMSSLLLAVILSAMLLGAGAQAESYTVHLQAHEGVYAGPGFADGFVKNVGEDGVYTIVEESLGSDGFLWGRLKSGAGWVRLSDVAIDAGNSVPYTVPLLAEDRIYAGPSADHGYVKNVGEDGVYTIVEESAAGGFLWGRLKSGAGWVILSELEPEMTETPYTIALKAWLPIHEGPGYDFGYAASVSKDGVYTIVEEAWDYEGNLWGRLRSGAGWIDVTYARSAKDAPFIAAFADDALADQDGCILVTAEESDYSTKIALIANEKLTNVRFSLLDLGEFDYVPGKTLYEIKTLTEDTPFVAEVIFYGDMTAYGFEFTDADGEEKHYAVSLSGRNGALYAGEFMP